MMQNGYQFLKKTTKKSIVMDIFEKFARKYLKLV